jgi:hypothetical protein
MAIAAGDSKPLKCGFASSAPINRKISESAIKAKYSQGLQRVAPRIGNDGLSVIANYEGGRQRREEGVGRF